MSSSAGQPGATDRRKRVAVLGLLLLISIIGINRDLWTPDEPREAEISREMAIDPGIVPTLNGRPFVEKPPLYYWTVASVFAVMGKASAPLARSVSVASAFLTLLVVFLWGRREFCADVGLVAAIGLAASVQFMISAHWVLIDPMLMLVTTLAAWAGWELVRGRGGLNRALQLYLTLAIALWIKGLIGPVLFGFGLLAYVAWIRNLKPIARVYPVTGVAILLAATGVLAILIYLEAGGHAVREWLWVNHIQRFIRPEYTGHEQPFYYYLHTLPTAIFPWWVPLADCLRPSRWRSDTSPWKPLKVYLAAMGLGMTLILSASATKRGIYLLPLLPLLALLLAAHSVQWWRRQSAEFCGNTAWWLQVAMIGLLTAAPVIIGLVYLRSTDRFALVFLALVAALTAALIVLSRRRDWPKALVVLGLYALSSVVGLMSVTAHLAAPIKDMTPFVQWLDREIPANSAIYTVGNVDETLEAIVPFVTGRSLIEILPEEVPRLRPEYILVQDKEGGETAPHFGPQYELLRDQRFGPGRYFAIWRRSDGRASSYTEHAGKQETLFEK